MPETASKNTARRTQAQRSEEMRKRLCDATLGCLIEDGYANTTVSSVCKRAGVSRGAFVHQYATKQALIQDVTETLLARTHRRLTRVLLGVAEETDRLDNLLGSLWEEIFTAPLYNAYLDVLRASEYDPELARTLQVISRKQLRLLDRAVTHYFEPIPGSGLDPKDLFILTRWLLGGMAAEAHLVDNPGYMRRQLRLWGRMLATQMRSRSGVSEPPPRI